MLGFEGRSVPRRVGWNGLVKDSTHVQEGSIKAGATTGGKEELFSFFLFLFQMLGHNPIFLRDCLFSRRPVQGVVSHTGNFALTSARAFPATPSETWNWLYDLTVRARLAWA